MKKHFLNYLTVILLAPVIFSSKALSQNDSSTYSELKNKHGLKSEPQNNWAINLTFSDNGFGLGAAKYFNLSKDISLVTGVIFSGAKDDREFDQTDIFGNSGRT